jgi:hypothetical protein
MKTEKNGIIIRKLNKKTMPSKFNPELESVIKESMKDAREKLPEGHHAQTIVMNALQTLLIESRDKEEVGPLIALAEKIRKELRVVTRPDAGELGILGDMGMAVYKEVKRLHV